MPQSTDLLHGTLELLVLRALALEPLHTGEKRLETVSAAPNRLSLAIASVLGRVAEVSA